MNWDQIAGEWRQYGAELKTKWAKLTDDDVRHISAKKDALIGAIQQRYGILKEEAERQVDEWLTALPRAHKNPPTRH
jgi:uncharacterized protein YjbJ (UPF0337 family)